MASFANIALRSLAFERTNRDPKQRLGQRLRRNLDDWRRKNRAKIAAADCDMQIGTSIVFNAYDSAVNIALRSQMAKNVLDRINFVYAVGDAKTVCAISQNRRKGI
ncbi:MAG: hypothetical protein LBN32_02170 [Helicobacteraceae bacterium]|jgi:hypothetical protein|nr:hypothetical protein [Helicobacteraceae bacterium]